MSCQGASRAEAWALGEAWGEGGRERGPAPALSTGGHTANHGRRSAGSGVHFSLPASRQGPRHSQVLPEPAHCKGGWQAQDPGGLEVTERDPCRERARSLSEVRVSLCVRAPVGGHQGQGHSVPPPGPRVSSKQESVSISGPGPSHLGNHRPALKSTDSTRRRGRGRKPLGMLTGSLVLTRKIPHGEFMTLEAKEGLQTQSPGRQGSHRLLYPGRAGWGDADSGPPRPQDSSGEGP